MKLDTTITCADCDGRYVGTKKFLSRNDQMDAQRAYYRKVLKFDRALQQYLYPLQNVLNDHCVRSTDLLHWAKDMSAKAIQIITTVQRQACGLTDCPPDLLASIADHITAFQEEVAKGPHQNAITYTNDMFMGRIRPTNWVARALVADPDKHNTDYPHRVAGFTRHTGLESDDFGCGVSDSVAVAA
jgi:hypothetical protein